MSNKKNLLDNFSPVSKTTWKSKLEKDLKGRPYEELHWTIGKDITIEPFYHADDNIAPYSILSESNNNDWEIGQDILIGDAKTNNKTLLDALQNGVNAPRIVFVNAPDKATWAGIFKDVNLNYISTHLYCLDKQEAFKAMANLMSYWSEQKAYDFKTLKGSINANHLKHLGTSVLSDYVKTIGLPLTQFKIFTVDATPYYRGKDHIVDELYQTIKEGNQLLDSFFDTEFSLETIAAKIQFSITVGTSYFVSIAKIRALHLLWANVLKAYQISKPAHIEAYLAKDNQEENNNTHMIRVTTQAMAAVIGHVNKLTVFPADTSSQAAADFSRRIARNVQHLLKMESHLDVVQDPAAGSYYIEKLTEELAMKAWEKFQKG